MTAFDETEHRRRTNRCLLQGSKVMEGENRPCSGPEGSRRLMLPDFKTAHEVGKVVSPMHRPPLLLGNIPGTHFC